MDTFKSLKNNSTNNSWKLINLLKISTKNNHQGQVCITNKTNLSKCHKLLKEILVNKKLEFNFDLWEEKKQYIGNRQIVINEMIMRKLMGMV